MDGYKVTVPDQTVMLVVQYYTPDIAVCIAGELGARNETRTGVRELVSKICKHFQVQ